MLSQKNVENLNEVKELKELKELKGANEVKELKGENESKDFSEQSSLLQASDSDGESIISTKSDGILLSVAKLLDRTSTGITPGEPSATNIFDAENKNIDSNEGSLCNKKSKQINRVKYDENSLKCPITKKYMLDPVLAADGKTYEREAIEGWLSKHEKKVSPITGEPLKHVVLIPNGTVKSWLYGLYEAEPDLLDSEEVYLSDAKCALFADACLKGDIEKMKELIQTDRRLVKAIYNVEKPTLGRTVLHFAASSGQIEAGKFIVELLKQQNLDKDILDLADIDGNTPMHVAVLNDKYEFLKLLFTYGANSKLTNKAEETPEMLARKKQHLKSLSYIKVLEQMRSLQEQDKEQVDVHKLLASSLETNLALYNAFIKLDFRLNKKVDAMNVKLDSDVNNLENKIDSLNFAISKQLSKTKSKTSEILTMFDTNQKSQVKMEEMIKSNTKLLKAMPNQKSQVKMEEMIKSNTKLLKAMQGKLTQLEKKIVPA